MQAIDRLFKIELTNYSSYKLSAADWRVLEGLMSILEVSLYGRYQFN
jgi:hypothetical protein